MPDTAIVLLPGIEGSGLLFQPLLRVLPRHFVPLVVSYPRTRPLDYEQLLPLVLELLPRGKPHLILGESFAGPLALMAAATHPAELRGVVLCATFVTNPLCYVPRAARHIVVPMLFRAVPWIVRARLAARRHADPALSRLVVEANTWASPAVWAARARAVLDVDATVPLRTCHVPIVYLQGTRDRVVPAHNMRRIAAVRPDVRVVPIDAPHMLLQTRPVEAAAAITAFEASLDASQS